MDEPSSARLDSTRCFSAQATGDPAALAELAADGPLVQLLLNIKDMVTERASRAPEADWACVVGALQRATLAAHFQHQRHVCELASMRDVVLCELTDREANSARVAERQQVLSDRVDGSGVAFERAVQAAEAIEETMLGLELQCMSNSQECGRLLAMDLAEP